MATASLDEFESIMLQLAELEGWTFCDDEEEVAREAVFNDETYGPALLLTAQLELESRGLPVDLGVDYEVRPDAMLGVGAVSNASATYLASIWRLCLVSFVIESLPKRGASMDLALLRGVFAQRPEPRTVAA